MLEICCFIASAHGVNRVSKTKLPIPSRRRTTGTLQNVQKEVVPKTQNERRHSLSSAISSSSVIHSTGVKRLPLTRSSSFVTAAREAFEKLAENSHESKPKPRLLQPSAVGVGISIGDKKGKIMSGGYQAQGTEQVTTVSVFANDASGIFVTSKRSPMRRVKQKESCAVQSLQKCNDSWNVSEMMCAADISCVPERDNFVSTPGSNGHQGTLAWMLQSNCYHDSAHDNASSSSLSQELGLTKSGFVVNAISEVEKHDSKEQDDLDRSRFSSSWNGFHRSNKRRKSLEAVDLTKTPQHGRSSSLDLMSYQVCQPSEASIKTMCLEVPQDASNATTILAAEPNSMQPERDVSGVTCDSHLEEITTELVKTDLSASFHDRQSELGQCDFNVHAPVLQTISAHSPIVTKQIVKLESAKDHYKTTIDLNNDSDSTASEIASLKADDQPFSDSGSDSDSLVASLSLTTAETSHHRASCQSTEVAASKASKTPLSGIQDDNVSESPAANTVRQSSDRSIEKPQRQTSYGSPHSFSYAKFGGSLPESSSSNKSPGAGLPAGERVGGKQSIICSYSCSTVSCSC